jgi:hypothetical protein
MKKLEIDGRQVDLGEPQSGKAKTGPRGAIPQIGPAGKFEQGMMAGRDEGANKMMRKTYSQAAPSECRVFVGNLPKEVRIS